MFINKTRQYVTRHTALLVFYPMMRGCHRDSNLIRLNESTIAYRMILA